LEAHPFQIPGPLGYRQSFRHLGALRWRYCCRQRRKTWAAAHQDPEFRAARTTYFARQSDYNQACKKATTTFLELFPGVPSESEVAKRAARELPIHYTKNWHDQV